jgi:N-methylhydantoinase B
MTVKVDPVTFQIIRHKLVQVIEEATIALENVSGSPITNEGHDLMVSLYKADGSLMVGGVGFLHHLTSASQAVKHIVQNFSEDPGIFEDDIYILNDAYTAALHPPDVYLISPIYHDGKMTGFVANFVHVTDIGAIDPGGFSPNARESFHEGFQTKGLKIVERGKTRRDVLETFLNMVRDVGMTSLDLKSQMAANHVAKDRMKRLYETYSVEIVDAVSEELIRQSEMLVRQRLSELPDGEWQVREYIDMEGEISTVNLKVIKEGDSLTYDFTGSSPQASLGINCCYWASWGGLFAPIFPLLAWDVVWNDGVTKPITMIAPEGSVINCQRPAPISIATVGAIQIVNNLSTLAISKMMSATEKYKKRATGVWHGSHAHLETHGLTAEGEYFVAPLTDTFCGAAGARAFKDGVDLGGEIPNVVSRWANVETQELNTPLRYLYRRPVPDSGGPGKYRGGVCHEYAFTAHGTGEHAMGVTLFGKGTMAPMSLGVSGGLPGCNVSYINFYESNADDLPTSLDTTKGKKSVEKPWGTVELEEGDVQYIRFMGGGGYGDPIDREPSAVLNDVHKDLVSDKCAREIYGVVLDLEKGEVDEKATAELRLKMRSERVDQAVKEKFNQRAEIAPSGKPISEYLQQADSGSTQCTWCGNEFAEVGDDWKDHAVLKRVPVSAAGPLRTGNGQFFLIHAYCPTCATLLDTDLAMADDPPLYDRIKQWPTAG